MAKKVYGCHVTGICSGKNGDFVRGMGADEVLDYTAVDVAGALLEEVKREGMFDLYIDCVGGVGMFEHWVSVDLLLPVVLLFAELSKTSLLHSRGAYVTIVGDKTTRSSMGGPLTYLTWPSQVFRFLRGQILGPRYANIQFQERSEWLEEVKALAEDGKVEVEVQEVVPGILDDGSEAWRKVFDLMEEGRVRGKIVVNIS